MVDSVTDGMQSFKASPRETRRFIIRCIEARLVPFIQSSPGVGKSSIVKSIAKEFNLKVIDHRLSTSAPEDLSGLPRFTPEGKATFAPFDIFPTEDTPVPEGYDGWMLFLDEFNSGTKAVQAAAYKLILDQMVGQHKLNPRVVIVCAGNLSTDRAIVNSLSTAMQSRMVHIEMEVNNNHWLADVALKENYDSRIIAYISYMPGKLMDFRPDHNDKTFCCPRTWEFMNNLIKGKDVTEEDAPLYAGTITSGVAVEFIQFTKVFNSMPKYNDILANPANHMLPTDPPTRWATIIHILEHFEDNDLNDISVYIGRLPAEFQTLFYRIMLINKQHLRTHPAFAKAIIDLSRYLHD